MMDFLLEKDLDINQISDELGTPLDWAIAFNQLTSAKYLLSKKAKCNLENKNMPPGIHLAINSNGKEMIDLLLDQDEAVYQVKDHEGWSTLHIAAEVGNLDLCKKLAEKVDPNY